MAKHGKIRSLGETLCLSASVLAPSNGLSCGHIYGVFGFCSEGSGVFIEKVQVDVFPFRRCAVFVGRLKIIGFYDFKEPVRPGGCPVRDDGLFELTHVYRNVQPVRAPSEL